MGLNGDSNSNRCPSQRLLGPRKKTHVNKSCNAESMACSEHTHTHTHTAVVAAASSTHTSATLRRPEAQRGP